MDELLQKTKETTAYLKKLGYQVIEMWGCEWSELKLTFAPAKEFCERFKHNYCKSHTMNKDEIVKAVCNERLFGMVECSLHVPAKLRDYFAEMTPIFKNVEIGLNDVSGVMKEFAVNRGLLKTRWTSKHLLPRTCSIW